MESPSLSANGQNCMALNADLAWAWTDLIER